MHHRVVTLPRLFYCSYEQLPGWCLCKMCRMRKVHKGATSPDDVFPRRLHALLPTSSPPPQRSGGARAWRSRAHAQWKLGVLGSDLISGMLWVFFCFCMWHPCMVKSKTPLITEVAEVSIQPSYRMFTPSLLSVCCWQSTSTARGLHYFNLFFFIELTLFFSLSLFNLNLSFHECNIQMNIIME